MISATANAQENLGIFQGGYSSGQGSSKPTGFKVTGSWEFQPAGEIWTIGGSVGYIRLSGSESGADFSVTSVPICAVTRFMFGGEKFKAYVRAQGGTHISTVSYSGSFLSASDTQLSMALGIGGGAMYWMSEKMFLNAEYEGLWLMNAFANSGAVTTGSLGVGFRF